MFFPCSQNCFSVHFSFSLCKYLFPNILGLPFLAAFSDSINHTLIYKTSCVVLTVLLLGFPFPPLLEDECPSSHSSTRIHDPTLSYSPLELQSHILSHLQVFPVCLLTFLVSSILKNKPKQRKTFLRPCYFP